MSTKKGTPSQRTLPWLLASSTRRAGLGDATRYTRRHVMSNPADLPAKLVLAALYAATARPADAFLQLDEVMQVAPNHGPAHFLAGSLLYLHRDPRSLEHFKTYLSVDPHGRFSRRARFMISQLSSPPQKALPHADR